MLGHTAVYYADLHSLVVFGGYVPYSARYRNFLSDYCVPENIHSHFLLRKVFFFLAHLPPFPNSLWKYPVWVHTCLKKY